MCLGLAEAIARLQSPDASEAWSVLHGAPVFAADARGARFTSTAGERATAVTRLAALPCPTVAIRDGGAGAGDAELAPLLDAFDVVVEDDDELDAVLSGVMHAPLAAATLVHVLRAGRTLAPVEALRVESLAYATLQGGPEFARWLAARPAAASPSAEGAPPVRLERVGDTLAITLDRPARHNAFSARMRDALTDALGLAAIDPRLQVTLRGAGPSFCSGGDLDEFGTFADPATAHLIRTTRSPARLLAAMRPRVRAEVHGACIGAGVELAAFAHEVTATADAFFQLPEVAMGLVPGAGGTVSLPARIGRQRTALLALGGRRLDAATARAWGLVDTIVQST